MRFVRARCSRLRWKNELLRRATWRRPAPSLWRVNRWGELAGPKKLQPWLFTSRRMNPVTLLGRHTLLMAALHFSDLLRSPRRKNEIAALRFTRPGEAGPFS